MHIFIGLIVGFIMGLTGAGGAMISIPLFMATKNSTLKEATILSLLAVIAGSSINLMDKISTVDKKAVLLISAFGIVANLLSLPLKSEIPDYVIVSLLITVAAFSLWSIWKRNEKNIHSTTDSTFLVKGAFTGIILGVLTTLTGLGGGIILLPMLVQLFNKSYDAALPTSLATILLISVTSFLFQIKTSVAIISLTEIAFLLSGIFMAYFLLKLLMKMNHMAIERTRKIVFTFVAIYSSVSIIIKSL